MSMAISNDFVVSPAILEMNKEELRKIDPRLIQEPRYADSAWRITKIVVDILCALKVLWNSDRISMLQSNISKITTSPGFEKEIETTETTTKMYSKKNKSKTAKVTPFVGLFRKKEKIAPQDDLPYQLDLLFGSEDKVIEETRTAQAIYNDFFGEVPNFGEHFKTLFKEQLSLPEGTTVVENGNLLTITLPAAKSIRLDPEQKLSQEKFDALNRKTNTEGLKKLNADPHGSWKNKTIPKPSNSGLRIKDLTYFGSIGSSASTLWSGTSYGIAKELVLQRSENGITVVKGGPADGLSIEFLKGYEEQKGLIKVKVSVGFMTISDVYFGKDLCSFFDLGKIS